jgi:hypothetical protein
MTRVSGIVLGVDGMSDARTAKGGSARGQIRPDKGRAQVFVLSQARLPQGINDLNNNSMMAIFQKKQRVMDNDKDVGGYKNGHSTSYMC